MTAKDEYIVDVVIPVWNRPNETRNCLVNLINFTPRARFIMYDSGSDRETERLLEDFAEGLDDRALLMRDDTNVGFVRSANRGLKRSEARFLALVRNSTLVSDKWLEPLLDFAASHPEAGILLPCLTNGESTATCRAPIEVASGSFAAMVISREAYEAIGGLDEAMDGGEWCLRDYTRRACANGFLSYRVPGPLVNYQDEVVLGSERRRRETLERSRATFAERWGDGLDYVLHVPKGVDLGLLSQKLELLVVGARHGDRFTVLLPAPLHKAALQAGLGGLHEHVTLLPLPRLALEMSKRKVFEKVLAHSPRCIPVTAVDGFAFPWSPSYLTFTELSDSIRRKAQPA
ncbi:glycosyl transferase [Geomonas sp. Red276]